MEELQKKRMKLKVIFSGILGVGLFLIIYLFPKNNKENNDNNDNVIFLNKISELENELKNVKAGNIEEKNRLEKEILKLKKEARNGKSGKTGKTESSKSGNEPKNDNESGKKQGQGPTAEDNKDDESTNEE